MLTLPSGRRSARATHSRPADCGGAQPLDSGSIVPRHGNRRRRGADHHRARAGPRRPRTGQPPGGARHSRPPRPRARRGALRSGSTSRWVSRWSSARGSRCRRSPASSCCSPVAWKRPKSGSALRDARSRGGGRWTHRGGQELGQRPGRGRQIGRGASPDPPGHARRDGLAPARRGHHRGANRGGAHRAW